MGPSSGDDGEREALRALDGREVALQWGRHQVMTESIVVAGCITALLKASMGPSSGDDGEAGGLGHNFDGGQGFNGAVIR